VALKPAFKCAAAPVALGVAWCFGKITGWL
jgi:hypothetical protein